MDEILSALNDISKMNEDEDPVPISDLWKASSIQECIKVLLVATKWYQKFLASLKRGDRLCTPLHAHAHVGDEELEAPPSTHDFATELGIDLSSK